MRTAFWRREFAGYCAAGLGIAVVTAICVRLHQRFLDTTAALALLLVVLFVALGWRHRPALFASIAAMLSLNYFFLPPVGSLTIVDPENWVALTAFFITAVTVGQLSAKLGQRAEDAEIERRNARRANAYNRGLIEASIDPLFTVGKDGTITDVNLAAEAATGCPRRKLVGSDFSLHFTDAEKAREGCAQVFRDGTLRDYPLEMRDSAGQTTAVQYNATVYRDEAGEVAGVFAAARDVSWVVRAQQELQTMVETIAAERRRLRDVLDVLPAYVILLTPEYQVAFTNRFFRERFGEPHGLKCYEYLFRRNTPCEVCETYKVLKTMEPGRWEWTGPDGRNYDIFDFPFREGNGSQLILEMGLDVTERKRADSEIRRIGRTNRALSRCNESLIRATDESTLLQKICNIVIDEAGYRLCWVGRADHDAGRTVTPAAWAGYDKGYLQTLNLTWADVERGHGPTGTSIRTHQTILTQHIATDPRMELWHDEAAQRGYASSIAIPLIVDSEAYGALSIYASEPDAFGAEEIKLLEELANDLAFGIESLRTKNQRVRVEAELRALSAALEQRVEERTAELHAATAELETARKREVEIASRIQQTLLLDRIPENLCGLRAAALTLPSQQIDGDFYTFFQQRDGSLDVVVGDVMGKGVPAALLGAAVKSCLVDSFGQLIAGSGERFPEPKDIVALAHSQIARQLIDLDSFVTLCYARVATTRGVIELVDCGHTGTIQWHARTGRCDLLRGNNLPFGIREDEIFAPVSFPIEPGDLLLFYSDGITEARNRAAELFGVDRLKQAVMLASELEPAALVQSLRQAVAEFSGGDRLRDDLTAVAVRVLACADLEIQSDVRELRSAREFVRGFCRDAPGAPMPAESANALELAVHEAACNIIKHAYAGRTDQLILLHGEAFPGQVSIRLRHSGDPFDPSTASAPAFDGSRESGFGAYIISRSVDEVRYYRDEQGRNWVALVKNHK